MLQIKPMCKQHRKKKKGGGAYLLQVTLVTLVLVELVHFGVYAILFDLLENSVILFGA